MIMRKKKEEIFVWILVPESWFSRKSCWEKTADLNDVMIITITKPASWRIPAKKKKRMFNQPNKLTKWMNRTYNISSSRKKELTGKFYTWINLLAAHHQYQTINEWMNVVLPCIVVVPGTGFQIFFSENYRPIFNHPIELFVVFENQFFIFVFF